LPLVSVSEVIGSLPKTPKFSSCYGQVTLFLAPLPIKSCGQPGTYLGYESFLSQGNCELNTHPHQGLCILYAFMTH